LCSQIPTFYISHLFLSKTSILSPSSFLGSLSASSEPQVPFKWLSKGIHLFFFFFFLVVLGFELRAYTLSHSTNPFL
jgi:hypothetical protein